MAQLWCGAKLDVHCEKIFYIKFPSHDNKVSWNWKFCKVIFVSDIKWNVNYLAKFIIVYIWVGDRFLQWHTNQSQQNEQSLFPPRRITTCRGCQHRSSPFPSSSYRILSSIGTKTEFRFAVLRFDFPMYRDVSACADTDTDTDADVSVRYAPHTDAAKLVLRSGSVNRDYRTWYTQRPLTPQPQTDGSITLVAPSSAGIVCIFKVDLPGLHMYLYLVLVSSAEFRLLPLSLMEHGYNYISVSHVV